MSHFDEQIQKQLNISKKSSIYHYTSMEALKSILENKALWLSDISFMNDESEIEYTLNLVNNYIDSVKKYDKNFKNTLKEIIAHIKHLDDNNIQYKYYVISFSLNSDSLPIWIYYTKNKNSTGCNIEFDRTMITNIIKKYSINDCLSGEVIYNKTKQLSIIRKTLDKYYKLYLISPKEEAWNSEKQTAILSAFNDLKLFSLFFKSSYFKNEEEYRIVIPVLRFGNKMLFDVHFRINDGVMIPFLEISFKDNIKCVRGLTISPTIKTPLAEKGLKEFVIAQKYKDLNIEKSKIPLRY